jgi:hypothetical protein
MDGKKKNTKFYMVGKLYAEHFIPNPMKYKYVSLQNKEAGAIRGNLIWVKGINRRTSSEITKDNIEKFHAARAESKKVKKITLPKLMDPKDSIIKPLDKYFLRKEDHDLAILHDNAKPLLDHNFRPINVSL